MSMKWIGVEVAAAAVLVVGVARSDAQTTPTEIIAQLKTLR